MTAANRSRLGAFWASSVGKKIVMGVTGVILVGFVLFHMAGNLQIFLGRTVFNHYSELLHTSEELLWVARIILLASVVLHIVAALQLTARNRAARTVAYAKRETQVASLASRVMLIGGLLILVFVPIHILNFTTGDWHPDFVKGDVYGNVIYLFAEWPVLAAFYIVTMVFVGYHLYHGAWAMLRTLGVAPPSPNPQERRLVKAIALVTAIGFAIVPVAILLGLLR